MTNKYEEIEVNFIEEARFAKLVSTPRGNAILIAGTVLEVSGPPHVVGDDWQPDFATVLVKALRRGAMAESAIAGAGAAVVGISSARTAQDSAAAA